MIKYAISFYSLVLLGTYFSDPVTENTPEISQADSLTENWERHIQTISEELGSRIELPTDSVFKNIKSLKGMPAKRLLAIMKFGYSRSLGVGCGHCHNTEKWESEEKPQIEIARKMGLMAREINSNLLKSIDNLQSDNPVVNCTTCHRGQVKPALNLSN